MTVMVLVVRSACREVHCEVQYERYQPVSEIVKLDAKQSIPKYLDTEIFLYVTMLLYNE